MKALRILNNILKKLKAYKVIRKRKTFSKNNLYNNITYIIIVYINS
jgi:hypothetical protein